MDSHSVSEGVSRMPNEIFTTTGTDDNINKVGTGHSRFNCKFAPILKIKIGSFCDIKTFTTSRFVPSLDSRNFLSMT